MTQLPNDSMTKFHNNPMTQLPNDFRLSLSFFLPGLISLIVAIFDEIYQSYIPTRDASIIDVFLDTIGIVLAIYLVTRLYKIKK
jgi:VanZ family protein